MIVSLADLQQKALSRPEGYLETVLAVSQIIGTKVHIPEAEYLKLRQQYQPQTSAQSSECGCCKQVT